MVSSNPRIDFDNAFAFLAQYPVGTSPGVTVYNALISNTASKSVIENPSVTHFGSNFINANGLGTMIFAVNATP